MIFQVALDFTGSLILNSVKVNLTAGKKVAIPEEKLDEDEIQMMIERKILIPAEIPKKDVDKHIDKVLIVNKTSCKIVLGKNEINSYGTLLVHKDILHEQYIIEAQKDEKIHIIDYNKTESIITKKNVENSQEEEENTPLTWDFRQQKVKEAEKIQNYVDIIDVDEKQKEDNQEEIAELKQKNEKKTAKKQTKKKVSQAKNRKVKEIEPVGEIKEKDIAIEMDSRGNPIDKPSDTLQSIVDEISFVDKEQTAEKIRNR